MFCLPPTHPTDDTRDKNRPSSLKVDSGLRRKSKVMKVNTVTNMGFGVRWGEGRKNGIMRKNYLVRWGREGDWDNEEELELLCCVLTKTTCACIATEEVGHG